MRDACCLSPRLTRSAIRRWCGGRPRGSGSRSRLRPWPRPRICWSLPRVVFRHPLVRSAVYRAAGRTSGARSTAPWRKRPTRRSTPTGAPGTGRRRRPCPMRTSPPSWSVRPAGPRRVAVSRPPPPSSSARSRSRPNPRAARSARSPPRREVRRRRPGDALGLLVTASQAPLDDLGLARVDLLQAQIAFDHGAAATPAPLLRAAGRLEPLDPELARETYLEALGGAMASDVRSSAARRRSRPPHEPRRPARPATDVDVLLDAFTIRLTEGYAAAAPTLHGLLSCFSRSTSPTRMSVGGSRSPPLETATSSRSTCGTTMLCIISPRAKSSSRAIPALSCTCSSAQFPGEEPVLAGDLEFGRFDDRRSQLDR